METRLLIGGELVAGDGAPLDVENPFDESMVATLGAASAEQVARRRRAPPTRPRPAGARCRPPSAPSCCTRSPTG